MTSLPLIIAEELDADWSRVKIVPAPVNEKIYGNPGFSSALMELTGVRLRHTPFTPERVKKAFLRCPPIQGAQEQEVERSNRSIGPHPGDRSSEIGAWPMRARTVVLLAVFSALWLFGLIGQVSSGEATMRYLALSMAILAVGVWRWRPRPALRRRSRDGRPPVD